MTITNITSFPSQKTLNVVVPDAEDLTVQFIYNFFQRDEELVEPQQNLQQLATFSQEVNFNDLVPRYAYLTWKKDASVAVNNENPTSITANITKVLNEESLDVNAFTPVELQDTQRDEKVGFFVQAAAKVLLVSGSALSGSVLDVARSLSNRVNQGIGVDTLASTLLSSQDIRSKIVDQNLEEFKNLNFSMQVNDRLVNKVLNPIKTDVLSFFGDEAETATTTNQTNTNNYISPSEYELNLSANIIKIREINNNPNFVSVPKLVGFIINRITYVDGIEKEQKTYIVDSPNLFEYYDLSVRYGALYSYQVSAVYEIEFPAVLNRETTVVATVLLKSRPTVKQRLLCVENVAPPYPSDFNVFWDYQKRFPVLRWSLPVNPQRDIKAFQILKRKSVTEPFQLVKQYNFNDSETPFSFYYETPEPSVVETLKSPRCFYTDYEFQNGDIYTLCSVDAHGLVSTYSSQLEIKFDKFENKLTRRLVSSGDAPRCYPNAYLNSDVFQDTIKTEGKSKLDVYFNPEFLTLKDNQNRDLGLLASLYKLQILNLATGTQEIINVNLEE